MRGVRYAPGGKCLEVHRLVLSTRVSERAVRSRLRNNPSRA